MTALILPKRPWVASSAALTCGTLCRSPEHLRQVLAQFDLSDSRYAADKTGTKCNIYAWDASRALSCELPH